ncbi:aminotransferase class I/II-fold pyridoxal phosphate-dependent enzyme [Ensifer sp. T173]|uniref:Aminotransferase n=1 Tax=Ensifer canadensis TaxID=555315 RepID=A0AAW4FN54_9HYPH|nr:MULTISPECIES: pyridoxal phosphate-dependent aminotransferase [Ensifer]KQW78658.1 aspartate aminotransferase [Ensifer sp. Root127]MBM3092741.1 aminotransferase class I/II-fold pyridoxal phosphate-dependent enzyme [Ensifer canadensis]NOV21705.1 pyridoxal phosphate-dependent aminotransferase [Ensifer canadensis]UBI79701.1 pyridoxal phosphate-dependent aminotransferase [Ensifer canadensis]
MNFENKRAAGIKSSPSMAIAMAAKKLIAEGRDIIDLSLGEPDFEPPAHVAEAACEAIRQGRVRYGVPAGMESLRQAIVSKFKTENQLNYAADEVMVANGAKQILFDVFLATLELGDEVIIPTPCWVSYGDIVSLHGGDPVYVSCGPEVGFKIDPERLEASITSKTRWLLLNSPSNPTGAIYSAQEYRGLAEVLARHPQVLVLSDEIYEHILLREAPFISFASACPELRERTLIVNGVSKAYAMTGWRVGYAAGPKALIASLNKMQSQSVTSVSTVAQAAALAALTGDQAFVAKAARTFADRAKIMSQRLAGIEGIDFTPPEGAFYAFIGVGKLFGRKLSGEVVVDDTTFAAHLLQQFGLSSVPGAAFGAPGFIRLSIAASERELERACERLASMVRSLKA